MKKFLGLALLVLIVGMFVFPVVTTHAAGLVPCGTDEKPEACTLCHLVVGFSELTKFFLKVLVAISLAGITISGVMYVVSAGSDKAITQAKSFLTASVIGFAVVLGAWVIVNTTMWLLATRDVNSTSQTGAGTGVLGIGIESWDKFTCSPAPTVVP